MEGVIFDFDGTIVELSIDFKKIKEKILNEAKERKLKIPEKNYPILELLEKIRKLNKEKGEEFYLTGHKILREEELKACKKTRPKEGAVELIEKLKENGIKVGIITRNCKDVVYKVVNKFNIPYDVVLTRDDVEKVKPDPFHIKKILEKLNLKKENVLIVGDHPFDVRCGKKLNLITCGVLSEYTKEEDFIKENADFILDDIREIEYVVSLKGFPCGKLPNKFLKYLLEKYTSKDIFVSPGIGIDCAIFKFDEKYVYAKTDPITLTSKDIGFYLVNINVNDISVMGGIPLYFLCCLFFPKDTKFNEIEYVFSQISKECKKFNIKWIGGHTEIIPDIKNVIGVGFTIGKKIRKIKFEKVIPEDIVFLVNEIGIEGASIIAREKYEELKKYFSEKYLNKIKNSIKNPGISIFKEAKKLWENLKIKYMHDPTEGGISTGLYEISESKNIGLLIDLKKLRFYKPVIKFCKILNLNPLGIISSGCIIGIISKKHEKKLIDFCRKNKIKFEIIGKVIKGKGVFYKVNDKIEKLSKFQRDEINKLTF
jgi:hydrogenase expression/formation protein HypE